MDTVRTGLHIAGVWAGLTSSGPGGAATAEWLQKNLAGVLSAQFDTRDPEKVRSSRWNVKQIVVS